MMCSKALLDTVSCAPQVIPPHPVRRRVYWAHFVGIACNTPTLQRTIGEASKRCEGGAYYSLKMVPPYRFAHPKCSLLFHTVSRTSQVVKRCGASLTRGV